MDLEKWMLVIFLGLLTGMPCHALDSLEGAPGAGQQEELQADSSSLPFHYEQIQLLSLQQAVEQGQSGNGGLFPDFQWSWIPALKDEVPVSLLLQDIRFLLEIQLFPFHSFW